MARVKVSVSINDDHLPRFAQAVEQLKKSGLHVDQVLPSVGVVTGSVDDDNLAALERLPSVASVEQSRAIQIAPPESDVQ